MSHPTLMDCGHWSYWYEHVNHTIPALKGHIKFGPGCQACFNKMAPNHYARSIEKKYGVDADDVDIVDVSDKSQLPVKTHIDLMNSSVHQNPNRVIITEKE